jgi:hypothetical protein
MTCHPRPASPPGRAQSPGPTNHTTPTEAAVPEAADHCLDVHEEFLVVRTAAVPQRVGTSFGLIFQLTRCLPKPRAPSHTRVAASRIPL